MKEDWELILILIITYRNLIYIKDSIAGLEKLNGENNFTNKSMIALLVYLNFNCSRFITYCIGKMEAEINNLSEKTAKLDKLAHCLKRINQMQEKPGVAFKQNNESVKQQLGIWVSEEIYFLEHQQRLFSRALFERGCLNNRPRKASFSGIC